MLPRRRGLQRLLEPGGSTPSCCRASTPSRSARSTWPSRPRTSTPRPRATTWTIGDVRHDGARHDDPVRPAGHHVQPHRLLHLRRRGRRHLRVLSSTARPTRSASRHARARPRARRPRLPGLGHRHRRQRRAGAGRAALDGHRSAGDDDRHRPGCRRAPPAAPRSASRPTRKMRSSSAASTASGSRSARRRRRTSA